MQLAAVPLPTTVVGWETSAGCAAGVHVVAGGGGTAPSYPVWEPPSVPPPPELDDEPPPSPGAWLDDEPPPQAAARKTGTQTSHPRMMTVYRTGVVSAEEASTMGDNGCSCPCHDQGGDRFQGHHHDGHHDHHHHDGHHHDHHHHDDRRGPPDTHFLDLEISRVLESRAGELVRSSVDVLLREAIVERLRERMGPRLRDLGRAAADRAVDDVEANLEIEALIVARRDARRDPAPPSARCADAGGHARRRSAPGAAEGEVAARPPRKDRPRYGAKPFAMRARMDSTAGR